MDTDSIKTGSRSRLLKWMGGSFLVILVGFGAILTFSTKVPRDQDLLNLFRDHHEAFERLREMVDEDHLQGWHQNASDFNELNQARQQEYQSLMSKISPELSVGTDGRGGVKFYLAGGASFPWFGPDCPEWDKGIEYIRLYENVPGDLLTNLDQAPDLPAGNYFYQINSTGFLSYWRFED